jgi:hypothetical protein
MTTTIHQAMVEAQAEFPNIDFDSNNPAFKSKYASLGAFLQAVRPILNQHGLYITHSSESCADGICVSSSVVHGATGERLTASVPIPLEGKTAQKMGGALTYGRRYTLSMLLGVVADEDDDGNEASKPVQAKKPAVNGAPVQPKPQPVANGNGHKPHAIETNPLYFEIEDDPDAALDNFLDLCHSLHMDGTARPASEKMYNYISGLVDEIAGQGAHNAIFERMAKRPVSKENPISNILAGSLLDWLATTKKDRQTDTVIANPKYDPKVGGYIYQLHARIVGQQTLPFGK